MTTRGRLLDAWKLETTRTALAYRGRWRYIVVQESWP